MTIKTIIFFGIVMTIFTIALWFVHYQLSVICIDYNQVKDQCVKTIPRSEFIPNR